MFVSIFTRLREYVDDVSDPVIGRCKGLSSASARSHDRIRRLADSIRNMMRLYWITSNLAADLQMKESCCAETY